MGQIFQKGSKEYRYIQDIEIRSVENNEDEFFSEGYAATYVPTILFEYDGVQYKEKFDRNAFSYADISDVIFNYNHKGKVLARTRNKTLSLNVDDIGLFTRAKLDGTDEGRKTYQEIKGGYLDRMSLSFTVEEDEYDKHTHTRTILKVKKIYDVSVVDIPAYDSTSIYARSYKAIETEIVDNIKFANELQKRKMDNYINIKNILWRATK